MVEFIRVALGTAIVLGLWRGKLQTAPTTAHFLTYFPGKCLANCQFCPQAKESSSDPSMLSRVVWPKCEFDRVIASIEKHGDDFSRICVQAVNYPNVVDDLLDIISRVKEVCSLPISVACQPLHAREIKGLVNAGVERIGIALDAATSELFEAIKGEKVNSPYSWQTHIRALEEAKRLAGRATTHLVVGLGETEEEMIRTIQFWHDRGITSALFAFTPIHGTPLAERPRPDLSSYRRIQLARYLVVNDLSRAEKMVFSDGRLVDFGVSDEVLNAAIGGGEPFMTSGCPGCNRPFYNESPMGPIYNYPRRPTAKELKMIKEQLGFTH